MDTGVLGVIISREEYDEYIKLKQKNTPMKKRKIYGQRNFHCPSCNYVVDNIVPTQNYCDRCGQRLYKRWYKKK